MVLFCTLFAVGWSELCFPFVNVTIASKPVCITNIYSLSSSQCPIGRSAFLLFIASDLNRFQTHRLFASIRQIIYAVFLFLHCRSITIAVRGTMEILVVLVIFYNLSIPMTMDLNARFTKDAEVRKQTKIPLQIRYTHITLIPFFGSFKRSYDLFPAIINNSFIWLGSLSSYAILEQINILSCAVVCSPDAQSFIEYSGAGAPVVRYVIS